MNDEPIRRPQPPQIPALGHANEVAAIKPAAPPPRSNDDDDFNFIDATASSAPPSITHENQSVANDIPMAITYGDQPRRGGLPNPVFGFSFLTKRRLVYAVVLLGFNFVFFITPRDVDIFRHFAGGIR